MHSTDVLGSTTTRGSYSPLAIGTVLGAIAFTALGVFGDGSAGADHSPGQFFVMSGVIVVTALVVLGVVVPRWETRPNAAGVGLGLSIAGLLLVAPAFWSGLPAVLATGGVLLGGAARRQGRGGVATAAIVLGTLALIGYAAIYVADWMSTNNIAGM
jgi:hypothetical protein